MGRLLLVLFVILAGLPRVATAAGEPVATTQPAAIDAETMARAELNLLRRITQQQRDEIAALRQQIAQLTEQLKSLGIAPVVTATPLPDAGVSTTQPSDKQVRRVVFVLLSRGGTTEVERAAHDLAHDQWFNVVVPRSDGSVLPFQPQLTQPSQRVKDKLPEFLKSNYFYVRNDWRNGLAAAAKWRPDVIWLVGTIRDDDEEKVIAEIQTLNFGKARINTTTAYLDVINAARQPHLLWRIAHETGGVCVDKSGQPIDEPVLPVPAPRPAEPARKPSILREGK